MSRKFTEAEIAEVWERRKAGEPTRSIARRLGRNGSSIRRLFEDAGGVRPAQRTRSPRQLSLVEREEISRGVAACWERLRYDWSDPRVLRGRVIDSNLFKPGSTWELWATPEEGGTRVEIRAVRHLRGRGWLLAPFFLPLPAGSAAATVRDHLRHFLASIEAPNTEPGDET